LYGCETWKITQTTVSKLQTFINRYLRKICDIHWPQIIANEELRKTKQEKEVEVDWTNIEKRRNSGTRCTGLESPRISEKRSSTGNMEKDCDGGAGRERKELE
jgi:hypothetical protein